MSSCRHEARPPRLPTETRSASRRPSSRISGETRSSIEDHVRRLQRTDGLQRQQLGVAGAGTDQDHLAAGGRGSCLVEDGAQLGLGRMARARREGEVDEALPEGPAQGGMLEPLGPRDRAPDLLPPTRR